MKICYDQTKYVKGKRVYRIKDMIPGNLYLFEDICFARVFLAEVNNLEHSATMWGIDYRIVDTFNYHLSSYDIRLWEYMIEQPKHSEIDTRSIEVYEAVEPHFTCKLCGSHDLPNQVQAVHIRYKDTWYEQRVGYSCNYGRCIQCNTLQRHVVNSGYTYIGSTRRLKDRQMVD